MYRSTRRVENAVTVPSVSPHRKPGTSTHSVIDTDNLTRWKDAYLLPRPVSEPNGLDPIWFTRNDQLWHCSKRESTAKDIAFSARSQLIPHTPSAHTYLPSRTRVVFRSLVSMTSRACRIVMNQRLFKYSSRKLASNDSTLASSFRLPHQSRGGCTRLWCDQITSKWPSSPEQCSKVTELDCPRDTGSHSTTFMTRPPALMLHACATTRFTWRRSLAFHSLRSASAWMNPHHILLAIQSCDA